MRISGLLALTLAVACLGMATMAGAGAGYSDTEIVIGGSMPYTGPPAVLGYAHTLGLQVAAAEINDAGGINGRKIRLIVEDDNYVPARAVQNLRKLIDVDDVFAMGSTSGTSHTLAMLPLLEENGIPSLNTVAPAKSHVVPPRRTLFAIGMSYEDGAFEVVRFMKDKYPDAVWASIVQDDETGQDQERGYERAVRDLKINSVSQQRFKRGQTDFSSEILRLKKDGVTALFAGGIGPSNAMMAKEAKKLGLNLHIGAIWITHAPQVGDLMGEAGDGMVVYDYVPSIDDPSVAPFLELARKYLKPEDFAKVNRYTMMGYVGLKVQAEAIRRCGDKPTRDCMIEQLETMENFETGLTSPITFRKGERMAALTGKPLVYDFKTNKFLPAE